MEKKFFYRQLPITWSKKAIIAEGMVKLDPKERCVGTFLIARRCLFEHLFLHASEPGVVIELVKVCSGDAAVPLNVAPFPMLRYLDVSFNHLVKPNDIVTVTVENQGTTKLFMVASAGFVEEV